MPNGDQIGPQDLPRAIPVLDQRAETESHPAMEVHLGEVYLAYNTNEFSEGRGVAANARHCIIWHNGKRFEGTLFEEPERKHGDS